ncbi:unnamed protein product [Oncorhynchus mykiss]|uniref:Uncharacterized protein n=1 Tax=Oncorhynchus mykiss TaxID=8022 RepID=A0A060W998_ONCMY|nr:unnamed protein product [Oncorhynchus mykiss]
MCSTRGPFPSRRLPFAHLNDNIKEQFLAETCAKFGEVEIFTSTRKAKDTVKHLHNISWATLFTLSWISKRQDLALCLCGLSVGKKRMINIEAQRSFMET